MKRITTIGIDLAKNSFQLHGVDANGKAVLRKTLRRDHVIPFFANLPECLVGMEACATSAYWARVIESCGHTVHRIHPRFIKPYLMADKNDANDAAAICEAVSRPRMRFVPHKSQEQADLQAVHRVRSGFVQAKTAAINQARGLLAENGIIIKQGACHVRQTLPAIIGDLQNDLSSSMRQLLTSLYDHIVALDARVTDQDRLLQSFVKEHEACKRLIKVPGVGILTSTILLTMAGAAKDFKNGRQFAAYLGLVPRQHSTGGKQRLLGITKRGDSYTRTLLVQGARAVLGAMKFGHSPLGCGETAQWLARLVERRGPNKACIALANKTARVVWSMLAHGSQYQFAV
ncbi:MAG: IS110 family transposase [Solidesulfovibrio sp.]